MLVCKRSTGEKLEKKKERKGTREREGGKSEEGRERKRKRGRKKTREEGAGQSYYKNPQNNRRGSH